MRYILLVLIFLNPLFGTEERHFFFEGFAGQPEKLLSVFLPATPRIVSLPRYPEGPKWPGAQMTSSAPADLLHLRFSPEHTLDLLTHSPDLLSSAQALLLDTFLFPYPQGTLPYQQLKQFLKESGFIPLSSWIREGAAVTLLFLKRDLLYNTETARYLQSHFIDNRYQFYQQLYFPMICYCLDDDKEDSVKQTLMTGHPYEGTISLMIRDIAKPASLAIDIGAHVGVHTLFMSHKVGDEGAVLSFEPNKKLYLEHRYNLQINQRHNVIPIAKGLGEVYKRERLHRIKIEQEGEEGEGQAEEIEIIPLDSLHLREVSLIKMDVENYEYFVLKGAEETILANKPAILFECWIQYKNTPQERENFERVMALLASYGYEIYIIYNCDFLAIPSGTRDEALLFYKGKLKPLLDPKTYHGADPS